MVRVLYLTLLLCLCILATAQPIPSSPRMLLGEELTKAGESAKLNTRTSSPIEENRRSVKLKTADFEDWGTGKNVEVGRVIEQLDVSGIPELVKRRHNLFVQKANLKSRSLMEYFSHPQGLVSFSYPAEWNRTEVVTREACFAAHGFDGELLFEAFTLAGPNPEETIPLIRKAMIQSLKSDHPQMSVVSTESCVGFAYPCELTRVAYSEKVSGRFSKVETITDLYLLADGNHALGLFFKVVKERHAAMQAPFEQVVRSARVYASENW